MALTDDSLDKMLDDLKTTVTPDGERSSSRRDNSLVSSFRSSSRSESRNSNRSAVEDGGLMKHQHKEYTSPDKSTRVVTDQFEYESDNPNKYQKKVMKSTYSNYKVSGDITSDLDSLRQGPDPAIMEAARSQTDYQNDTKVVSASQKVANKLVDALSTIGPEGDEEEEDASNTLTSDQSTLTRLNKNILELDTMLDNMDSEEAKNTTTILATVVTQQRHLEKHGDDTQVVGAETSFKSVTMETDGSAKADGKNGAKEVQEEDAKMAQPSPPKAHGPSNSYSNNYSKTSKYTTSGMTNGKPSYDDDAEIVNDTNGGEVRRIVWRNRFEKTYEGQDGTPSISIEEEARRRNQRHYDKTTTSSVTAFQPQPPQRGPVSPRQLQLQYAVYWPNHCNGGPNISPGSQSWADPIPMPTPPQVSPKGEPGVAYVYTYGQNSTSQVQHLPPLNYVSTLPSGASVPPSEGAPSPTPSGTQPIIYHYSYHYTLQPGQTVPEGGPPHPGHPGSGHPGSGHPGSGHPGSGHPGSSQPSLQVASPQVRPPTDIVPVKSGPQHTSTLSSSYDYKKHTSHTVDRSDVTNVTHHHHHHPPGGAPPPSSSSGPLDGPRYPRGPPYDEPNDVSPYPTRGRDPHPHHPDGGPNRNIMISINKNTTHTTLTKDYPPGGPSTSTPFPTPGRSRSSSPDRCYPRGPPGSHPYGTVTHRTSYSDSLDRVRRPPNEGLPFPDTSPIKPKGDTKIPRRVDDLMTSFSDTEDGPNRGPMNGTGINGPRSPVEREPLLSAKLSSNSTEISLSEQRKAELKKEETKNVAGPPVYYPPGHNQLFDESMHTMTLKENKRRGMAKWRMEKASGYKESSSSSESKGGMAMVPVCLPLCCGAACAIM